MRDKGLEKALAMIEQLRESFLDFAAHKDNPYTIEILLKHYNKLWAEYCDKVKKESEIEISKDYFDLMMNPESKDKAANILDQTKALITNFKDDDTKK